MLFSASFISLKYLSLIMLLYVKVNNSTGKVKIIEITAEYNILAICVLKLNEPLSWFI